MTTSGTAGARPSRSDVVLTSVSYAGPWRRLVAWLIDIILWVLSVLILILIGSLLVGRGSDCRGGDSELCSYGYVAILLLAPLAGFLVVSPLYSILLLRARGRTLGMQAVGIRAEGYGRRPHWGRRWVVGYLPLLVPFVGSIVILAFRTPILRDGQRQGVHDRASGTVVLRTEHRGHVPTTSG
jgi:uncharacterized RDD family membrane protein YckC